MKSAYDVGAFSRKNYSERHNKFLFPFSAQAIYGSFCRTENEIFNVVNDKSRYWNGKDLYAANSLGARKDVRYEWKSNLT